MQQKEKNKKYIVYKLTSDNITIVEMHCSEIIRQKSVMVVSSGSCVMTNDSELS